MDTDKILTELATLKEQGRWHTRDLNDIKLEQAATRKDIKSLDAFRWQVIGMSVLASMIVGLGVEVVRAAVQ